MATAAVTPPPTSSMTTVNTVPVTASAPVDSFRESIKTQLRQKADQQANVGVVSQWNNLVMAAHIPTEHTPYIDLPEKPPVTADVPKVLAAIRTKTKAEFTSEDGKKYTIDGALLNQKVDELPLPIKLKALKGANSLQEMFPKDETLDSIAGAIADGADEAKKNVGFGDFLKTLFAYIGALIGSWLGHGKAVSWDEAKAQVAAPKVTEAINQKLDQLAATDPEAKRLLDRDDGHGHTTKDIIDDMAVNQTYKTLGATPPPSTMPASIALKDVKPEPVSGVSKNDLHVLVAQTIMMGVPDKDGKVTSLADTISGEMEKSVGKYTGSGKMLSAHADEIKAALKKFSTGVAPAVAEAFTDVVTHEGADAGKMTKEAYVKDVTDKVMEKLTGTSNLAGLPKDAVDPAITAMRNSVAERVGKMYPETVAVSVIAASATGKEDDTVKLAGSDAAGVQAAAGRLQTDMLKAILPSIRSHAKLAAYAGINDGATKEIEKYGYTMAGVSDWIHHHKVATAAIGTVAAGPLGLLGAVVADVKSKELPTSDQIEKAADATTMSVSSMFSQTGFLEKFIAAGKESDGTKKQEAMIAEQLKKDLDDRSADYPALKGKTDEMATKTAALTVAKMTSSDNAQAIVYAEALTTDLNARAQAAALAAKQAGVGGGQDVASASAPTTGGTGQQTGANRTNG